jgi:hypothetical protein
MLSNFISGSGGDQTKLALAGARRETTGMTREELEERVDEILLKRTRGEKLTRQEEKILAYGYYAARNRSAAVRVRFRRET